MFVFTEVELLPIQNILDVSFKSEDKSGVLGGIELKSGITPRIFILDKLYSDGHKASYHYISLDGKRLYLISSKTYIDVPYVFGTDNQRHRCPFGYKSKYYYPKGISGLISELTGNSVQISSAHQQLVLTIKRMLHDKYGDNESNDLIYKGIDDAISIQWYMSPNIDDVVPESILGSYIQDKYDNLSDALDSVVCSDFLGSYISDLFLVELSEMDSLGFNRDKSHHEWIIFKSLNEGVIDISDIRFLASTTSGNVVYKTTHTDPVIGDLISETDVVITPKADGLIPSSFILDFRKIVTEFDIRSIHLEVKVPLNATEAIITSAARYDIVTTLGGNDVSDSNINSSYPNSHAVLSVIDLFLKYLCNEDFKEKFVYTDIDASNRNKYEVVLVMYEYDLLLQVKLLEDNTILKSIALLSNDVICDIVDTNIHIN